MCSFDSLVLGIYTCFVLNSCQTLKTVLLAGYNQVSRVSNLTESDLLAEPYIHSHTYFCCAIYRCWNTWGKYGWCFVLYFISLVSLFIVVEWACAFSSVQPLYSSPPTITYVSLINKSRHVSVTRDSLPTSSPCQNF